MYHYVIHTNYTVFDILIKYSIRIPCYHLFGQEIQFMFVFILGRVVDLFVVVVCTMLYNGMFKIEFMIVNKIWIKFKTNLISKFHKGMLLLVNLIY